MSDGLRRVRRDLQPLCSGLRHAWRQALSLLVFAWISLGGSFAALTVGASAQDAAGAPPAGIVADNAVAAPRVLPADVVTRHMLELPGRTIAFTARAGSIPIRDKLGNVLADIAFTAYAVEGAPPRSRPLTFAFNGGPGSASTWLHLGAMGPWRVPLTAETIARGAGALLPNGETWLDFTDLVFIDPPGTGQSVVWPERSDASGGGVQREGRRASAETSRSPSSSPSGPRATLAGDRQSGGQAWFWSLDGDIETFNEFIATYTRQAQRFDSPIVLVGESYGGFRAPLIAEGLARDFGTSTAAIVLVSPVIDFDARRGGHLPMHYVNLLPSLAATHVERSGGDPTRETLAEIEAFARGPYLLDLTRGLRDAAAVGRMVPKVAQFTGLPQASVQGAGARASARLFVRSHPIVSREPVSLYDAGMTGFWGGDRRERRGMSDVFTSGLSEPLRLAMAELHERLGWRSERRYMLLAPEVTRSWIWRNSPYPPQALDALHLVLQSDARRQALVTHGFTDLVTPYMASRIQLDMLPPLPAGGGKGDRVHFEVYPGGHMFYSRDWSRARFREDGARVISNAIQPLQPTTSGQRETP